MVKAKTILITAAAALLSACATQQAAQNQLAGRMDYTIEQNEIGDFVFCRSGDCPAVSKKVLAEVGSLYAPVSLPQAAQGQGEPVTVFFSLGSSRLGVESRNGLSAVLPKLKNIEVIYLRGWADSIGGKQTAINRKLARQRAAAVAKWLRRHGVKAKIFARAAPPCCNSTDTRSVVIRWDAR